MGNHPFDTPLVRRVCELLRVNDLRDISQTDAFSFFEKSGHLPEVPEEENLYFSGEMFFFRGITHVHFESEGYTDHGDEKVTIWLSAQSKIVIERFQDGRIECSFRRRDHEGYEEPWTGVVTFSRQGHQLCDCEGNLLSKSGSTST